MEKHMKDSDGLRDQKDQKKSSGSGSMPFSKNTGYTRNEGLRDKQPVVDRDDKVPGDKNGERGLDKADNTRRK